MLALAAPLQASAAQASPVQAASPQAGTAQASPAEPAQAGRVSIVINSMTPQTARPGATVTVTGTVSNETGQAAAGLDVQLLASPARFSTRDQMDQYASQGTGASLQPVGSLVDIAASLKPGATAKWRASFQVNVVGITEFGVYPVTAQLVDMAGDVLASDPTLLPFWPGQQAAGLLRPLDIGWTWPLIDQPHHQVCSALTNSDLTGSLGTEAGVWTC